MADANVSEQLFVVPGLLDEVRRARLDGVDDVADGAVRGDHDDGQIRGQSLDAGQKVDAGLARQRKIE